MSKLLKSPVRHHSQGFGLRHRGAAFRSVLRSSESGIRRTGILRFIAGSGPARRR
jgi:hypothetical protein